MKETLKSPFFTIYCILMAAMTIVFFVFLHHSIQDRQWHEYFFGVLLYPAAMYGLGAFFGPLIRTQDYAGEAKAFHLAAFVVVNLVQFTWVIGFAPKNLIWLPVVCIAWSIGLWFHLRADMTNKWEKA